MKVVILAGGFGARISEETKYKPKPMIEIGGKPILWHIMKGYSYYGFNEFIICAGYKQHIIKSWFADYFLRNSDVTFDFTQGRKETIFHHQHCEPWKVTVVDTGLKLEPYLTLTIGSSFENTILVFIKYFNLTKRNQCACTYIFLCDIHIYVLMLVDKILVFFSQLFDLSFDI